MLRAAAWTGVLFVAGVAICLLFPGPWVEPIVLLAMGAMLFFLSRRRPAVGQGAASRRPDANPVTTRAAR
jgi:chromate transport protein ChrA